MNFDYVIDFGIRTQLQNQGYSIVDFFSKDDLLKAKAIYNKYLPEIEDSFQNGLHMTNWLSNSSKKHLIKAELENLLQNPTNRYFKDYLAMNEVFIIKKKDEISNFPFHQDWSIVDENIYTSINVWIALQDTTPKNGGLFVLKKHIKPFNPIRGAGKIDYIFNTLNTKSVNVNPIKIKAGQAIFFTHNLVHGSPNNTSDSHRIIISTSVISKEAKLLINYLDENNNLFKINVDKDFSYQYEDIRTESIEMLPKGKIKETITNFTPIKIDLANDKNGVFKKNLSKFLKKFKIKK